jgi:hypothetical protein
MSYIDKSFLVRITFPVKIGVKGQEFWIDPFKKGADDAGLAGILVNLLSGNSLDRRHRNP